jgi:hypothetical protein
MIAIDLGARNAGEVARIVRALGSHRYIAGRMHLVHAFAFASLEGGPFDELTGAAAWATKLLESGDVDIASKDERLWRPSTEAEIAAVLTGFWSLGGAAQHARDRLRAWLARAELPIADAPPFDPDAEEDIHPLLVDAGWELVPLADLDPERHRGAISAFGDALAFDVAKFEEAEAIPPIVHLQELPAIGPAELLAGVGDDGLLAEPLDLWIDGNEPYHDYVIRGVRRQARLSKLDEL